MYAGQTLFAQLMDSVPWTTFARLVKRYDGDRGVRVLTCAEQYRAMAFAQLTYRESLRNIETCLSVQPGKLYHMGFREPVRRSTLADANEMRDWRIYAGEDLGLVSIGVQFWLRSRLEIQAWAIFGLANRRMMRKASASSNHASAELIVAS